MTFASPLTRRRSIFLGCVFLVLFLLFSIGVQARWFHTFDVSVWQFIQTETPTRLDFFFSLLTFFATFEAQSVLLVVILFAFQVTRKIEVGFFFLLGTAVEFFGKAIIVHPKPIPRSIHHNFAFSVNLPSDFVQTPYSFPSGHTLRVVFTGALLCFLLWHAMKISKPVKIVTIIATVVCVALILYSRISLNQHWPTDVIGAVFLGLSLVYFATSLLTQKARKA